MSSMLEDVEASVSGFFNTNNSNVQDFLDTNDSDVQEAPVCGFFEGYDTFRFTLIFCASLIAVSGIFTNSLLCWIFATRRYPTTPTLYLAVLALLDVMICCVYILLFGVDSVSVYMGIKQLFLIWHEYILPVFCVSRTTQMAIPYMLIFATFERLMWISGGDGKRNSCLNYMFSSTGRRITIALILLIAMGLRLPMVWAYHIQTFPNCSDFFRSLEVYPTELFYEELFYIYDFYCLQVIQMFLPFVILVILNLVIVQKLIESKNERHQLLNSLKHTESSALFNSNHSRENNGVLISDSLLKNGTQQLMLTDRFSHHRTSHESEAVSPRDLLTPDSFGGRSDINRRAHSVPENFILLEVTTKLLSDKNGRRQNKDKDRRVKVRNAIYTMVAIVSTYLVCNTLHLILNVLERMNAIILQHETDARRSSTFYIIFSDTVSFLYMFSSAIRVGIYAKCNPQVRDDIVMFFCSLQRKKKKEGRVIV
uniref:G-protein coupled receptors family 1 profile domain-containing protein n=1 Tax=Plectus sambesii TaxID=2011161 RepID=A0A914W8Q8_9BILA